MDQRMKIIEEKAGILADALPYIRDFNQKICVIEYSGKITPASDLERMLMQDIILLKSIGMKPVVVHDTNSAVDKFRENKRVANLLESLSDIKAIGVCGIDLETLNMTIDHDYIPVIMPFDIDTETKGISSVDAALEAAIGLKADKLIYLADGYGIYIDPSKKDQVNFRLTLPQLEQLLKTNDYGPQMNHMADNAMKAVTQGVHRVNLINGTTPNGLLLELFSIKGIGTVVIKDEDQLYVHER